MADALDAMIGNLRSLSTFEERAAKLAAPKLEAVAKRTASAGTDSEGKPWAPRKADGKRALANASRAVRAEADGPYVDLVVDGPEVWHQRAKEGEALPPRRIIPQKGDPLPRAMADACAEASLAAFSGLMGGVP